jgi:penicillin V acylase-like amidase (Ntn superfamily)
MSHSILRASLSGIVLALAACSPQRTSTPPSDLRVPETEGASQPASMPTRTSRLLVPRDVLADSPRACTALCLDNGDHCVFGANQDNALRMGLVFINKRQVLKTTWDPSTSGAYAHWVSKYGSVTINFVGYQMAWAGMNEAGLMISTMSLAETQGPAPDERPPFLGAYWVQYQLDSNSTVEQVIASDPEIRVAPSAVDHYLACDRTGDCAVIEFLRGERVVHRGSSLPVQALTNSTYEESLAALKDGDYWQLKASAVAPGGPAAQAGMLEDDRIIAVEGAQLAGEQSIDTFYAVLGRHTVGDEVEFTVVHPGETDPVTLAVQLAPPPEDLSKYSIPAGIPVQLLSLGFLPKVPGDFLSRFAKAAERLQAFEPADSQAPVTYAFDSLAAVSRQDTVWSFVFDPANMRVLFRTDRNPSIREVDMAKLDFSCRTPVRMLDVHAQVSGDVTDEFVAYTHEASLAHTRSFFAQYQGMSLSPFLVDTLLWGLESSPCREGDTPAQLGGLTYLPLLPPTVGWAGLTFLHRVAPFWIPLVALSLGVVVWRMRLALPSSVGTRLIWGLLTIVLGPIGLLAYVLSHRKIRQVAEPL